MGSKQLIEIKSIISSLLVSNPQRSTINALTRDFNELEGRPIPYQEMGYHNVEQFLQSIPDLVTIYGSGPNAQLEVIANSKSAHINSMVLKQKCGKIGSFKKPPKPAFSCNKAPRFKHTMKKTKYPSEIKPIPPLKSAAIHNFSNEKNQAFTSFKPNGNSSFQEQSLYVNNKSNLKFELDESDSHIEINNVKDKDITIKDSEPKHLVPEEKEIDKSRVPQKVKKNLQELIKLWPSGIECTIVLVEYQKLFKKTIHFAEYGYRSLIEMCCDLSDIFHYIERSSEDYILFDKNRPIPSFLQKQNVIKKVPTQVKCEKYVMEELNKIDASALIIPSDVITKADEVSRFFSDKIVEGDILDITVAEIFDLSKFWIYVTFGELDKLMADLQSFFTVNHTRYLIPEFFLEEGLYGVTIYLDQYHRCVVVNMLTNSPGFVRVFFFDYGTVGNVPTDAIWFLPKEFGQVPGQAIRARLANILPEYKDRPWPSSAIIRFQEMIMNRVIVAEVSAINEKHHVFEVYLADITNKNSIFYINDRLVKEGHAIYSDQEQKPSLTDSDCLPYVRYIHLYPEFYEIESGMVPTPDELQYIFDNDIPLHFFMTQYFNIYYHEDIKGILKTDEKFNRKKVSNLTVPHIEEPEFDLDYFPEEIQTKIADVSQNRSLNTIEKETKSVKKYFCGLKRKSELVLGKTPSDRSSDSSFSSVNHNGQDDSYLGGSKTTNPFLSDSFDDNNTNPFHSSLTNPFVNYLKETSKTDLLDLFSKVSIKDELPTKINNNLKEPVCTVSKQLNVEKEASKPPEESHLQQITEISRPRVRTPPGFSANLTQPTPLFVPNYALSNPYYQRFPQNTFMNNDFYSQNMCMTPLGNFYQFHNYYPNQPQNNWNGSMHYGPLPHNPQQ